MEQATLSMSLINKIGNLLAQRPYVEVAQILAELQEELAKQAPAQK